MVRKTSISDNSSKDQQDHFLPIANVNRIMKKSLPANAKISKEAKEAVQECVTEFISFITGEASEKCQMEKRKTINGEDLLWAMSTLGFDNYIEPLKAYLSKYRETQGEEKDSMAMKDQDHHSATSSSNNSLGEINQVASFTSAMADLHNLNSGDHLIEARVAANGKGIQEKVIGCNDSNAIRQIEGVAQC